MLNKTPMQKWWYIYMMANKKNGIVYIWVTNDLERRVFEHKNSLIKGFTSRYNLDKLVYYEEYSDIGNAISREKQLKGGNRKNKMNLIELKNENWEDLAVDWY